MKYTAVPTRTSLQESSLYNACQADITFARNPAFLWNRWLIKVCWLSCWASFLPDYHQSKANTKCALVKCVWSYLLLKAYRGNPHCYQDCKYLFSPETESNGNRKAVYVWKHRINLETRKKKSGTQAGPKCPIQENSYLSKEKSHIHILVLPS